MPSTPSTSNQRGAGWLPWAGAVLAGVLCLDLAFQLAAAIRAHPALPLWDGAARGLEMVQTARAIASGDILRFVGLVHDMAVWPPTLPLVSIPFVLGIGAEVETLRVWMLCWFVVAGLWFPLCALQDRGPLGFLAGFAAMALYLVSPISQLYGTLLYLEVPGVALQLIAATLYLRCRHIESRARSRWAALSLLALFFCKYNYGLLLILPIALLEWHDLPGKRQRLASLRRRWSGWRRSTRLGWMFVSTYLALLAAILITGGGAFEVAGQRVSLRSAGNPAYGLLLLLVVRFVLEPRPLSRRFLAWRRDLCPRHAAGVDLLAIPIAMWFLVPPHLKEFFGFVQNRSSGLALSSWDNLLWYPRAYADEFSTSSALAVTTWALAAVGLGLGLRPRASHAMRLWAWAFAVGLFAATLHPYKGARFFLSVAPWLWLLASATATTCLTGILRASVPARHRTPTTAVVALACVIGIATWQWQAGFHAPRFLADFEAHTVPNSQRHVVDRIVALAAERQETILLGTSNRLSPALVEWETLLQQPKLERTAVARPLPSRMRGADAHRAWQQLCTDGQLEQILVLDVMTPGRGKVLHDEETGWEAGLRQALEQSSCFTLAMQEDFAQAGMRLRCYRRRSDSPAP